MTTQVSGGGEDTAASASHGILRHRRGMMAVMMGCRLDLLRDAGPLARERNGRAASQHDEDAQCDWADEPSHKIPR